MTTTPNVAVLAGNAFVALFKREPSTATDAAWLNGYAAAKGRAVATEPGKWIDNLGRTHTCDQFDCQTTCDTCENTEVTGPPFTMERYGSFGACVIAERDWLRRAALDELVRLSEEMGLYDEAPVNRAALFERSYDMALERLVIASKYIPGERRDAYEAEWEARRAELCAHNRPAEPESTSRNRDAGQ